jgi:hypothetical protein
MKRTILYWLGMVGLVAGAILWQWQQGQALRQRLADLQWDNTRRTATAQAAPAAPEAKKSTDEDAIAAIQAALAMPAGKERDAALNAAGLQHLKPADALSLLKYFSTASARTDAINAIFGHWAESDPTGALAEAGNFTNAMDRYYAERAVVSTSGPKDPAAALAWVQTLPDDIFKASALKDVVTHWAGNDLPGALAWLAQAPEGAARDNVLSTLATTWAQTDPKAALNYMFGLQPGYVVDTTIAKMLESYAKTNPLDAAPLVMQMPEGEGRNNAAAAVGKAWAETDPVAAQQWSLGLPAGDTRDNAMASVAGGWAKVDVTSAMTWVQGWPTGDARDNAVDAIIDVWQYQGTNPQLMTELAAGMQEGESREVVYKVIAITWGGRDPDATAQWVQSLPPSPSKDMAAWMFAMVGLQQYADDTKQLAQAAPLVTAIQNNGERYNAIEALSRMWLVADPPTAQAWLAQTNLPDDRKQKLLNPSAAGK